VLHISQVYVAPRLQHDMKIPEGILEAGEESCEMGMFEGFEDIDFFFLFLPCDNSAERFQCADNISFKSPDLPHSAEAAAEAFEWMHILHGTNLADRKISVFAAANTAGTEPVGTCFAVVLNEFLCPSSDFNMPRIRSMMPAGNGFDGCERALVGTESTEF
jgi:hypothetical protein